MVGTITEVQLVQQPRLQPDISLRRSIILTAKSHGIEAFKKNPRDYLIRSTSLDRLKQFPTYLCTKSSDAFPNLLLFFSTALITVQSGINYTTWVLKKYSLVAAVIAAFGVLTLQFIGVCIGFIIGSKPPGLFFLIATLFMVAAIAQRTICKHTEMTRRAAKKLKTN